MKIKKIKSFSLLTYIIFSSIVVFSALVLLFTLILLKGEKSSTSSSSSQEKLREIILKSISSHGINPSAIQGYRDKKRVLHLKIDLPLEKYAKLEETLEQKLKEPRFSVLKKEERQDREKNFYLWEVKDKGKLNLLVLFSCHKESLEKEKKTYQKLQKNRVAIIIDDMGYSLDVLRKICSMKKALTISILPFSPLAKETAQIAHGNGLEVMLHLPLESTNKNEKNNYKGIILSKMSEEEVKKTLEENLRQIPFIRGVNNHMGSKITADKTTMKIILDRLQQMNLFFIDSVTTSKSIAFELAQEMGMPSGRRQIFLDSISKEDVIKRKLLQLFRYAQRNGEAIGICHPFDKTLHVLMENLHLVDEYNVELVSASQIVGMFPKETPSLH